MIDTVILNLKQGEFRILKPNMFEPPATDLYGYGNYFKRCVNNPTTTDRKSDVYKPRLTLVKRPSKDGSDLTLRIEFSAPKLLYNNNVDELEENDMQSVTQALVEKLHTMGVSSTPQAIESADVVGFHPSKNILITDGYTAQFVIRELNKVDIALRMDVNKTDFRNEGRSLQYYTNTHSFVVYDKMADLQKPKKRAVDKDQTIFQQSLFDQIKSSKYYREILRLEARLPKKRKMNEILFKLGFVQDPKFIDIFNKDLSKKIVRLYWKDCVGNRNMFLFDTESSPLEVLQGLARVRYNIKPKQLIYLVGLKMLAKDDGGLRALRFAVANNVNHQTWYRIKKDLKLLQGLAESHGWVKQITDQIERFDSIKLSTLHVKNCKV